MTESADVSVIIPAYNNAATIARALASVAAQTVAPRQVIVVDDGSDDLTPAQAESCRPWFAACEFLVLRQENAGAGAARNTAIAQAHGSWLAFLDADDEWLPEKLAASLDHLHQTDLTFVSHDLEVVNPDGSRVIFDCARHFQTATDPFVALFQRGFVATSTVVARRDAVQAAGGFETSLRAAQDYDLWLRLAAGSPFLVFSGALTRYHSNPQGITANAERRRRCSLAVLMRNKDSLRGRAGFAPMVVAKRLAIIHYEAASLLVRRRQWIKALGAVARMIPATLAVFPRMTAFAASCWVLAVMAAYLFQFRSIAVTVLDKVLP